MSWGVNPLKLASANELMRGERWWVTTLASSHVVRTTLGVGSTLPLLAPSGIELLLPCPNLSLTRVINTHHVSFHSVSQLHYPVSSVQFISIAHLCPTLFNPMNCSTPGLPFHHQLLVSTQTHVHCVGDAIQPSHPLSFPSSPALNLSQHQGLFK